MYRIGLGTTEIEKQCQEANRDVQELSWNLVSVNLNLTVSGCSVRARRVVLQIPSTLDE